MLGLERDSVSPVYLKRRKNWVFASSLDWPGWCRRGKGDIAAIDALKSYCPASPARSGSQQHWKGTLL